MYVNILAVIAASIVGFCIGLAWYSPSFFGAEWAAVMGTSWRDAKSGFSPRAALGIEFISVFVMAFVLGNLSLALGVHGPLAAIRLAVWVWLGFQATILFSSVLFERRPMKLFYVSAGERFTAMLAMALVLGLWR